MTTIETLRNMIIEMVESEIDKRLNDVSNYSEDTSVFHELNNEIDTLTIFKSVTRHILLENIEHAKLLGVIK